MTSGSIQTSHTGLNSKNAHLPKGQARRPRPLPHAPLLPFPTPSPCPPPAPQASRSANSWQRSPPPPARSSPSSAACWSRALGRPAAAATRGMRPGHTRTWEVGVWSPDKGGAAGAHAHMGGRCLIL